MKPTTMKGLTMFKHPAVRLALYVTSFAAGYALVYGILAVQAKKGDAQTFDWISEEIDRRI